MSEHEGSAPGHEATDITLRPLLIGAVLIAIVVVLLVLLANALFPQRSLDRLMHTPMPPVPAPQLQANPVADMAQFHAAQMQRLNSFGWLDHQHGIAHVPIEQAMRQVVLEGVPGWPAKKGTRP